jgi:ribonuclease J
VIYHPLAPVHVSGHASQEEQKLLLNILRPYNFIPIHGELRHLKQHAKLARELGIPDERIAVVENGYQLSFQDDVIQVGERVPGEYIFVDGTWVGDGVELSVIRDRETLATSGVCMAALSYDPQRGKLRGRPRLSVRGFATRQVVGDVLEEATDVIESAMQGIQSGTPPATVERVIRRSLSDYFYRSTKNRPEIIVMALGG